MFSSKDQQSEIKLLEKIEKIHSKFEQSLASLISNLFEKQIPMIRNEMNQEIKELILKYSKENKYYPTNEKKPIDIREYRR